MLLYSKFLVCDYNLFKDKDICVDHNVPGGKKLSLHRHHNPSENTLESLMLSIIKMKYRL